MSKEIKIWKVVDGDSLKEIRQTTLDFENRLENWLQNDISMISDDLFVIGRQVPTSYGGQIDLLCLERSGDLVVVELKRDRTPRDVVAQVLDYGSWVSELSNDKVSQIANEYLGDNGSLEEAFKRKFDEDLPEILNESHKLLIVASDMDSSSERIVRYLSNWYGVGINTASFQYLRDDDGSEFVARVFLIDPSQLEHKTKTKMVSRRRQYDEVDHFMYAVKERLSERLTSELMLKSSRWAGTYGSKRYFNFWYTQEPWNYLNFCFGTELETNKTKSDQGKVYVCFYVGKSYLKLAAVSEETTVALQQFLKTLDGKEEFQYRDKEVDFYLGKYIPVENLSSEESEAVADALAWLVRHIVPQIGDILH